MSAFVRQRIANIEKTFEFHFVIRQEYSNEAFSLKFIL